MAYLGQDCWAVTNEPVSYTHLRAHETVLDLVCRLLLEKTKQRGWRALVKLPEAKLTEMDEYLWTFQESSFLPHGRDDEPLSDMQPITLSSTAQKVENYQAVFLIGGTDIGEMSGVERCMIMINGRSEADVSRERLSLIHI